MVQTINQPTYVHLKPSETPPRLQLTRPFKAVLVADADVASDWQDTVATWLVRSGCLYFMAWGKDCSAWHDSVDLANVRAFNCEDIPDDHFILTTWHDREMLKDVFWFSEHAASHPTLSLDETWIIHIAANERRDDLLAMYLSAQDEPDE